MCSFYIAYFEEISLLVCIDLEYHFIGDLLLCYKGLTCAFDLSIVQCTTGQ